MDEVYIADANALAYRSFHAIRDLSTSTGRATNAVYGFLTTILKIVKARRPAFFAAAFDTPHPTFRHRLFAEYKIQRKPMPEELAGQLPAIREALGMLGIRVVEHAGVEADDVIATLAAAFSGRGLRVRIVTADKDALQLLSDSVCVVAPSDDETRDTAWFLARYGFPPDRMVDYLALAGDASDNIPGIPGVGPKTAARLLQTYGSVDAVYARIDEVAPERLRESLRANRPLAELGRRLAELRRDVPLNLSPEDVRMGRPDIPGLRAFFERLEFATLPAALAAAFPGGDAPAAPESLVAFSDGTAVPTADLLADPGRFRRVLEDPAVLKYGADLKALAVALARAGVALEGIAFDTACARHLAGAAASAADPVAAAAEYRAMLARDGMEYLFDAVEMPLASVLARMEIAGIAADRGRLEALREGFARDLDAIRERVFAAAGEAFNLNSPAQLAAVLFDRLKLPPGRKTKTGYSTDTSVLKALARLHPLPGLVLEHRELFKLSSTYVEGLVPFIGDDGRIHPTYNQTATATGRLSCSNPNLQNIPVRTDRGALIRRAFVAAAGTVFLSLDYSQIELRILAHLSQDPYLLDAFRNGRDIHAQTAGLLFPQDSLFAPGSERSDLRRIAKTINFGVIYGMSPFGLADELSIPVETAREFIRQYFERFRGVKEYIERVTAEAERRGWVATVLGRRRRVPELASPDRNTREFGKRAALNMPIQGTAADMIKLAMVRLDARLRSSGMRGRMVLQIHDELLLEAPPEEEGALAPLAAAVMRESIPLDVPVVVDVKRGPNYLEMEPLPEPRESRSGPDAGGRPA